MSNSPERWKSATGSENAHILEAQYADVFVSISEIDALGNRLFTRASGGGVHSVDTLVGLNLLRRCVTIFVGIRHLLETSAVEQAKILVRAQFELLLNVRYLVHGARRDVTPSLPSYHRSRQSRANYYMAAALREDIYRNQMILDRSKSSKRAGLVALSEEIEERKQKLQRFYRVQNARFGPLACYPAKGNPKYHDHRKWYSFGFRKSVNSVKQLAVRFGWGDLYTFTYSPFSNLTHPSRITHDSLISDSTLELFSPYMADAFEIIAKWTMSWQMMSLGLLAKAYHPETYPDVLAVYARTEPAVSRLSMEVPVGYF